MADVLANVTWGFIWYFIIMHDSMCLDTFHQFLIYSAMSTLFHQGNFNKTEILLRLLEQVFLFVLLNLMCLSTFTFPGKFGITSWSKNELHRNCPKEISQIEDTDSFCSIRIVFSVYLRSRKSFSFISYF